MPLTATQAQKRTEYIGASDVACIMLGPRYPWLRFHNQRSLFLEKTGRSKGFKGNEATRAGDHMEAALRSYATSTIGKLTRHHSQVIHPNEVMIATLDSRLPGHRKLGELKSIGQTNPFAYANRWGARGMVIESVEQCSHVVGFDQDYSPEFSDGLAPVEHWYQCQSQLACVNAWKRKSKADKGEDCTEADLYDGVYLIVNIPGTSAPFRHILVKRDDEMIANIENTCCDWYEQHVVPDLPPEDPLTPQALNQLIFQEEGFGVAPDEIFDKIRSLKAQKSQVDEISRDLENQIKHRCAELWEAAGSEHSRIRSPHGHNVVVVNRHRKATEATTYQVKEFTFID